MVYNNVKGQRKSKQLIFGGSALRSAYTPARLNGSRLHAMPVRLPPMPTPTLGLSVKLIITTQKVRKRQALGSTANAYTRVSIHATGGSPARLQGTRMHAMPVRLPHMPAPTLGLSVKLILTSTPTLG